VIAGNPPILETNMEGGVRFRRRKRVAERKMVLVKGY